MMTVSVIHRHEEDGTYPTMMLTTPGGNPASLIKDATLSAVKGVISDGFRTIAFPVANAGPIFHESIPTEHCCN